MALYEVLIPGKGVVHAGLDWVNVAGLDGEFKRTADRLEAAWHYSIKPPEDSDDRLTSFVQKSESKKAPTSGAGLLIGLLHAEKSFISLLKVADGTYWLLVVEDGQPRSIASNQSTDFVGDEADTLLTLRNIVHSLDNPQTPVFTDCEEIVKQVSFPLEVRPLSLEIIAESISNKDLAKFKYKRYTKQPVFVFLILFLSISLAVAGWWYWTEVQAKDYRLIQQKKKQELAKRKEELANQVAAALNATPDVVKSTLAYLSVINSEVPPWISGWKLDEISCASGQCNLTYKPKLLATWQGYVESKPKAWPVPTFGSDFEVVNQPLPVKFPDMKVREAADLLGKDQVVFDFGNLAQLSKEVGVGVKMTKEPARVAGTASDSWIPLRGEFEVVGPIVVLEDFVNYLPKFSGLSLLVINLSDSGIGFKLTGDLYAN